MIFRSRASLDFFCKELQFFMNVKQKPDDGVKGINSKGRDAFFNSIKKCYPATSTNKESGNTFFALTYNHGKRLVCKISVINRLQFKGHSQNSWLDDLILCSCYFLFIFQRIIIEALL